MTYLLIILLGILSAWEEVQQLVQRGSWRREDCRYPEWKTDYNSIWKNFDSHHFAFGLFVLVLMEMIVRYLPHYIPFTNFWLREIAYQIWVAIYWLGFFYVRNIGLHIIFKKKPTYTYLYKFWR